MAGGELRFGTSSIYMAHSIAILCQKQGKSAHLHVYILNPRTRTSRVKSRPSCFGKREVQVSGGASESASAAAVKTGLALGGGLEWGLTNRWTVKGEYLYLNFGNVTA